MFSGLEIDCLRRDEMRRALSIWRAEDARTQFSWSVDIRDHETPELEETH